MRCVVAGGKDLCLDVRDCATRLAYREVGILQLAERGKVVERATLLFDRVSAGERGSPCRSPLRCRCRRIGRDGAYEYLGFGALDEMGEPGCLGSVSHSRSSFCPNTATSPKDASRSSAAPPSDLGVASLTTSGNAPIIIWALSSTESAFSLEPDQRRTAAEKEFCALGPVAEAFISGAAAAVSTRMGSELAELNILRAAHSDQVFLAALDRAVAFGLWRAADVRSILTAGAGAPQPAAAGDALTLNLPAVPVRSLADYAIRSLS